MVLVARLEDSVESRKRDYECQNQLSHVNTLTDGLRTPRTHPCPISGEDDVLLTISPC